MFTQSLLDGIEGIVLDAVGTLIRPEPSVADVYLAAAARQGVALPPEEVERRFHTAFRQDEANELIGTMRTDESTERLRWKRIVARVLTGLPNPDAAFDELWTHFERPDAWRCYPDVAPALDALRGSGLPFVIASNFDARLRTVVAGLEELADAADCLVISSEVGWRKPAAAFYESACDRLGVPPDRVLWIGDDPENDGAGPQRFGVRCVLIDRKGRVGGEIPRCEDLDTLLRGVVKRRDAKASGLNERGVEASGREGG